MEYPYRAATTYRTKKKCDLLTPFSNTESTVKQIDGKLALFTSRPVIIYIYFFPLHDFIVLMGFLTINRKEYG